MGFPRDPACQRGTEQHAVQPEPTAPKPKRDRPLSKPQPTSNPNPHQPPTNPNHPPLHKTTTRKAARRRTFCPRPSCSTAPSGRSRCPPTWCPRRKRYGVWGGFWGRRANAWGMRAAQRRGSTLLERVAGSGTARHGGERGDQQRTPQSPNPDSKPQTKPQNIPPKTNPQPNKPPKQTLKQAPKQASKRASKPTPPTNPPPGVGRRLHPPRPRLRRQDGGGDFRGGRLHHARGAELRRVPGGAARHVCAHERARGGVWAWV